MEVVDGDCNSARLLYNFTLATFPADTEIRDLVARANLSDERKHNMYDILNEFDIMMNICLGGLECDTEKAASRALIWKQTESKIKDAFCYRMTFYIRLAGRFKVQKEDSPIVCALMLLLDEIEHLVSLAKVRLPVYISESSGGKTTYEIFIEVTRREVFSMQERIIMNYDKNALKAVAPLQSKIDFDHLYECWGRRKYFQTEREVLEADLSIDKYKCSSWETLWNKVDRMPNLTILINYSSTRTCHVCKKFNKAFSETRTFAIYDCCHFLTCADCAREFFRTNVEHVCPECNQVRKYWMTSDSFMILKQMMKKRKFSLDLLY